MQKWKEICFDKDKILVQSMTNTKTSDFDKTVKQINDLYEVGCDLVRVAIFDDDDINILTNIVEASPIPIIADIHFNYLYAIKAIESGVSKIRLNPGNITNKEEIIQIINKAKEHSVWIRIGVNCGSINPDSLKKYPNDKALAMIDSLENYLEIFKQENFNKIVVSLKASDPLLNIQVNKLASKKFNYPFHLGVTESGPLISGCLKSAVGLTDLLLNHIGNTIRISISDDPVLEVKIAHQLLNILKIENNRVDIVSCPTCGRLSYEMFTIVNQIEDYVKDKFFPLKISILGCVVNGIGEGKSADIGIAGSNNKVFLFEKGKIIKTVDSNDAFNELTKLIDKHYQIYLDKNKSK